MRFDARRASPRSISSTSPTDARRGEIRLIERIVDQCGNVGKPNPAGEEAGDGDFVRGVEDDRRRAARLERLARQPKRRENVRDPALRNRGARSLPGRAAAPVSPSVRARPARKRSGFACRGCPAARAPNRRCTPPSNERPIAGGSGCRSARKEAEQIVSLDQLKALVHHRRGIDRDFCAHRPVGMGNGLRGRCRARSRSAVAVRNGPPLAVRIILETSSRRLPARH